MSSPANETIIASERFLCVTPSGKETLVTVEIGRPALVDDTTATCFVGLRGFYNMSDGEKGIHGEGTLQALCLAIGFAHTLLHDLETRGCALYFPGDDDRTPCNLANLFGRSLLDVDSE